nr:MAG TPA: hypothetical protein [Caudoviricetes sp.]
MSLRRSINRLSTSESAYKRVCSRLVRPQKCRIPGCGLT